MPMPDERYRDVHLIDENGMIVCNPRDREAAHRLDVGDIAGTADHDAVTCKRCRSVVERRRR